MKNIFFILLLFTVHSSYADDRIIVSGSHITEIVFALDSGDEVVGADKTSTSPPAAANIAVLGHPSNLSTEGVLSLTPTMYISDDKYLNKPLVNQIEALGVKTLVLKQAITFSDLKKQITVIAEFLNKEPQGKELIKHLNQQIEELEKLKETIAKPQKAIFLYGREGLLIAGKNTPIDRLLTMAGIQNPVPFNGIKPMTPESVIMINPDVIITVDKALRGKGQKGLDRFLTIPAIAATPAGKNKYITSIPISHTNLGIGTPQTAKNLFTEIYGTQK